MGVGQREVSGAEKTIGADGGMGLYWIRREGMPKFGIDGTYTITRRCLTELLERFGGFTIFRFGRLDRWHSVPCLHFASLCAPPGAPRI